MRGCLLIAGLVLSGLAGAAVGALELAVEAVDAAGRVDELLLAREEGVALRADLDAEIALGGAGRPLFAACAVNVDLLISRMNFWL